MSLKKHYKYQIEPQISIEFEAKSLTEAKKIIKKVKSSYATKPTLEVEVIEVKNV